jgi:hypothetical protein
VVAAGDKIRELADPSLVSVVETPRQAVKRVQSDIEAFASSEGLRHVVVVNVASTEPPAAMPIPKSFAELEPLLDELRQRSGQRIALFGHAHCFRALAGCWLGLGAEAGRALTLGTASLSVIGVEHERPAIAHWNAVPLVKSPTPASTLDATRQNR